MTLVVVGVKVTMLYKFKFYNARLQKQSTDAVAKLASSQPRSEIGQIFNSC